jgi:hypothetical protein
MPLTKLTLPQVEYPYTRQHGTAVKVLLDAIVDAYNNTYAGHTLTADTDGRASMAANFFNEATATAKFVAGSITSGLLKAGAVVTAAIAANAVTGPKIAATGVFTTAVVTGADAALAPVSTVLSGAKVADVVLAVIDLTTPAKDTTHFEAAITVAGHIQQTSGTLTDKYLVLLLQQS